MQGQAFPSLIWLIISTYLVSTSSGHESVHRRTANFWTPLRDRVTINLCGRAQNSSPKQVQKPVSAKRLRAAISRTTPNPFPPFYSAFYLSTNLPKTSRRKCDRRRTDGQPNFGPRLRAFPSESFFQNLSLRKSLNNQRSAPRFARRFAQFFCFLTMIL